MSRSLRDMKRAHAITTLNITLCMEEARKYKAIQQRARKQHRIEYWGHYVSRSVRHARTASHHALDLRRQIEGELS